VDTPSLLQNLIKELESQPRIAVDTESNSLHAFRERVCLIQFSTVNGDFLVDPLALEDISPLSSVFANPAIEKIFHASEYDLICLKRDFSFTFKNIFDTMHAARVIGYKAVGLDRLLKEKFEIEMDKRHQKADWAERPLKPDQIHYARLDTHYLFDLRDVLEKELREKDRLTYALEDFAVACQVEVPVHSRMNGSWRRFGARKDVTPRELTVLYELVIARDSIAEKLDRPVFKVVDDDTLLAMARSQPAHKVDLAAMGLSSKQIKLWGDDLLEAIVRGVNAPFVKREPPKVPNDAVLRRLEKLKAWRKKVAEKLEVEPDIVLPKRHLSVLSETPPSSEGDLESIMVDSPTRFSVYGGQLLKLVGVLK
jgi:ribonuclease D